jgi:hypothetical protein
MRRSDNIGDLAAALAAAQGEFQAVPKTADNPFFHSKYADLPSVVLAASPILAKHGLSVSQLPDFDGEHDLLTTTIMHASGQWIEASARLYLTKQEPQAQGSATTYMRRYAYSGGIGIVTDTDDDGNAASTPGAPPVASEGAVACPQCGKPIRERTGAKGPFLGCSGWPACKWTANGTLAQFTGEGDVDPEDIPEFSSLPAAPPATPASDPLVQRIAALAKVASKDHVRDSFAAVPGGAACLAPMGDGTWKIRGAALAALSAESKQAVIDKLDDIPF